MLAALLTALSAYLLTSFLGYVVHWLMHQKWTGRLREGHMQHHVVFYPPKDLQSDTYRSAGSAASVWVFLTILLSLMFLPVLLAVCDVISVTSAVFAVVSMAVVGIANDVIHDSFHIRNHPLSRWLPGFKRMQHLHFIHHCNMKKNFGIYSFVADRVFRTLRKK